MVFPGKAGKANISKNWAGDERLFDKIDAIVPENRVP